MDRTRARALAKEYVAQGRPTDWFEVLYAEADRGDSVVPWADLRPNPNLIAWLDRNRALNGGKALKVGCGYGDDVEELARRGYQVVGFDVAPTAIAACMKRSPDSRATYITADVLQSHVEWRQAFDFVLESYTLQVLPPAERDTAIVRIADFVAPDGTLLVIARGRDDEDDPGQMPWPLKRDEVLKFEDAGLTLVEFEDYLDEESPPVRRFRATYRREI
jgi:SAM-dependent methyltransferase